MSRVDPLVRRYLDDPGGVAEEDLDKLVAVLRDDPAKAVELREQLLIDDHLSQKLAIDRQNFFAQIEQRLADFQRGEEEMYDHVAELRAIAEAQIDQPLGAPLAAPWLKYVLALALSLVVVAGVIAWRSSGPERTPVALVEEISGDVQVLRGGQPIVLAPGKAVSTGDEVTCLPGSTIEWKYKDGTTVRLLGDTVSNIAADPRSGAKRVELKQGELSANVAPQQRGPMLFTTPHATATVLGTELRLVVARESTQLDVLAGKVDLTRHSDGQTVRIAANETGVASKREVALRMPPWPVDRAKAVLLFEGDAEQTLVRNPQSGNFRVTPLESVGDAGQSERRTLEFRGGSFQSVEAGEDLTQLLVRTTGFTVQMALVPQSQAVSGTILTVGDPQTPWLTLRQAGEWLMADLDAVEPVRLGKVSGGSQTLVVIAHDDGHLAWRIGDESGQAESQPEAAWLSGPLVLGGAADGGDAWQGQVVRLAIYKDAMSADEMQREHQRLRLVLP